MPLLDKLQWDEGLSIGLWSPKETESELLRSFESRELYLSELENFKLPKRRIEFLSSRLLLNRLCGSSQQIVYDSVGRPEISGMDSFVSISHTTGCVAVAISQQPIGVDVERIASKAYRLRAHFMNDAEIGRLPAGSEIIYALLVWSAKESLYKIMRSPGVDFREHLQVSLREIGTEGWIEARETFTDESRHYRIRYQVFPDFVLTACFS